LSLSWPVTSDTERSKCVLYRPLGGSGIEVSAIGFGAWAIGGRTPGATSYGETDDAVSRRALDEAFDRGVTFYDTASVYGDGHSETLIGETFRDRRDRVVIATKAGILPSFRGYDFSAPWLRTSLEGSLRRLQTDYIDVLQLHNASADVVHAEPPVGEVLARFVEEGKIRAYGFSTPSPQDALALLTIAGTTCCQVNLNLLDWRAVDIGLFKAASAAKIGVIARTPLAFGFLTGRLTRDTTFDDTDHRSRWSRERILAWLDAADAVFAAFGPSADEQGRTDIALRFCLSFAEVSTVIPGMLSPEEVRANIAAVDGGLPDASWIRRIEQAYRRYESLLQS
jgi:aryl-alcohol dehydrogenase-like predicted oxidoreductase